MDHIRKIYFQNNKKKPSLVTKSTSGVFYHLINIPDYSDPSILDETNPYLFEEVTCYIDTALLKGNVLIHCRRGERRSPTLLMAWMLTRGLNLNDSIDKINSEYKGRPGWGESYRKARPLWMKKLNKWKSKYKILQKEWINQVNERYQNSKIKKNQIK